MLSAPRLTPALKPGLGVGMLASAGAAATTECGNDSDETYCNHLCWNRGNILRLGYRELALHERHLRSVRRRNDAWNSCCIHIVCDFGLPPLAYSPES